MVGEWVLTVGELGLYQGRSGENRFGFYLLLKHFQKNYCFPSTEADLEVEALKSISSQLNLPATGIRSYFKSNNILKKHRGAIRAYMGFRSPTNADAEQALSSVSSLISKEGSVPEYLQNWYISHKIERPSVFYWKRLVASANAALRDFLFHEIHRRITPETCTALHALLNAPEDHLSFLKSDPGRASLETVLSEIEKLRIIQDLSLPEDLTADISSSRLKPLYLRAGTESAWDFKRHPEHISLSLLA